MIKVDKISLWQKKHEDYITVLMNHMFVVYAFLIPLSVHKSESFIISLMLLFFVIRGNYFTYIKRATNPVSIAFLLFYIIHLIWSIGAEPITYNHALKAGAFYGVYLFLFLTFLDKRFVLYAVSAFLAAMMFSELISYAMYFELIPKEFYIYQVDLPWKSSVEDIMLYREDPMHHEATPFLFHGMYTSALAFSVSLMVYRVFKEELPSWYKIVIIFFILSMTANITLVGGRIGYFVYMVLLSTVLVYIFRKRAFIPLLILSVFVLIASTLAYHNSPVFKKRIDLSALTVKKLYTNPTDFRSSLGSRLGLWYYSLDVIEENPFFGVSEDNFLEEVYKTIPEKDQYLRKAIPYFHNAYISTLVQFGLFGLLIFLNIFYQAMRYKIEDKELNIIRVISILTTMLFISIATFVTFIWMFFIVMLAISMAKENELKYVPAVAKSKMIMNYALFIVVAITIGKIQ